MNETTQGEAAPVAEVDVNSAPVTAEEASAPAAEPSIDQPDTTSDRAAEPVADSGGGDSVGTDAASQHEHPEPAAPAQADETGHEADHESGPEAAAVSAGEVTAEGVGEKGLVQDVAEPADSRDAQDRQDSDETPGAQETAETADPNAGERASEDRGDEQQNDDSPQVNERTPDPAAESGGGSRDDLSWSPPSQQGAPDEPADTAPSDNEGDHHDANGEPASPADTNTAATTAALADVSAQLAELTAAVAPLEQLRTSVAELRRLRANDIDIIDRLHAENTKLRTGELAAATAPLLHGLVRLHDQMSSIAAGDQHSVAGMLRTQLLQLLEVAAGVSSYEPRPGETFDPARHTGAARIATADPAADSTVARPLRPGFTRADGSILRVAEVEVLRYTAPASTSTHPNQKEPQ